MCNNYLNNVITAKKLASKRSNFLFFLALPKASAISPSYLTGAYHRDGTAITPFVNPAFVRSMVSFFSIYRQFFYPNMMVALFRSVSKQPPRNQHCNHLYRSWNFLQNQPWGTNKQNPRHPCARPLIPDRPMDPRNTFP